MVVLEENNCEIVGREKQTRLLSSVYRHHIDNCIDTTFTKHDFISPPPLLFVYGHAGTGKSTLLAHLFGRKNGAHSSAAAGEDLKRSSSLCATAYLDCEECFTPRLLFDQAMNQWAGNVPSPENSYSNYGRCDNLSQFTWAIENLAAEMRAAASKVNNPPSLVLILDQAHRLRSTMPQVLSGLLLLPEYLKCKRFVNGRFQVIANLSIILVSTIVWDRFRASPVSAVTEPILLFFDDYEKDETMAIVKLYQSRQELAGMEGETGEMKAKLLDSFLELLYRVFYSSCKDLREIMYLTRVLFPIYCKPICLGQVASRESAKLFKHIEPYLKDFLGKLYLRQYSDDLSKISPLARNSSSLSTSPTINDLSISTQFELPFVSKYLMLASYLASYNPSRADIRLFTNQADKKNRQKKSNKSNAALKAAAVQTQRKMQHLIGPKPFPIERMMAIFYNIVENANSLPPTVDINIQISSLVSRRLLLKASYVENLGAIKLKCNVNLDFIIKLAKSVNFDINKYLYDFIY